MNNPLFLRENKIRFLLKDFTQDNKNSNSFLSGGFYKFNIDGNYEEKRLIRYVFKKFLNFEVWDKPLEKINWEIPFVYKNHKGSFAHQKFGFRLYLESSLSEKNANILNTEIVGKVNKAIELSEPLIRYSGIQALLKGEIIIENKYEELKKEFLFFVKESKRKRKKANIPQKISLSTRFYGNFRLETEANYLLNAAFISFFSLLEHLCLLGLAFTNSPERFSFDSFAQKKWNEKFKLVFPLTVPEFNDYYNKFTELAKFKRNPTAHGQLDKIYTIFHFYLPEAHHRIPMSLYDKELIHKVKNENNLDLLISFLELIEKNKNTKKWIWFLERNFDIYYEKSNLSELEHYMKLNDKNAKEHLDYLTRLEDDLGNMDW